MKHWQVLQRGDIVDLTAPSYAVTEEQLAQSVEYLENTGLVPRVPTDLQGDDLFHSNSDENRSRHLRDALYAEDSRAIWCLRGGYGCAKLLPMLAELEPPENPKLVIGFSDITALHIFLNQKWGWASIHGPLLFSLGRGSTDKESTERILDIVLGRSNRQEFNLVPLNAPAEKPQGNLQSTVTGGNLTIVQNSIGTFWQIDTKGKILLLEEVDDPPYHIDRMLNHLCQAGILDDVQAVIFGDFNGEKREVNQQQVDTLIDNFAQRADFPVFRSRGIGHTETNYAVPLGTQATITFGKEPKLICKNGGQEANNA